MGDILMLRPRLRPSGVDAARAEPRDAQILFFLGVRYERQQETPIQPPDLKPRRGSKSGLTPRARARKRPA